MKRLFFVITVAAMVSLGAQAKVRLPHLIGDGMVIQQNTEVRLWGWDEPGKKVSVRTSWSDEVKSVETDKDGKWMVKVASPAASFDPLTITFDDGEETVVGDVLAGEVWVCAGQSNMEMPVKGFGNCPVDNYNEEIINAADGIRSIKIPAVMSSVPLEDAETAWRVSSPETVGEFSATGYFFAKTVRKMLNIPIGLIEANKGGSRVESWLDYDNLKTYTDEVLDSVAMIEKWSWDFHRPLLWGNGTFHPILNYTVGGIIFYQGCSNVGDPAGRYTERLKLLVEQWRRDFDCGEIPFYFVEIAPYWNDNKEADWGARLREQQYNATKVIPNSAMVGTNDLVYPYEWTQIHPAQKQKVGERLAYQALNKTYGKKGIICDNPVFESMEIRNDTVIVKLDLKSDGISRFEDIEGFEIAGEDKVFYPAKGYHWWLSGGIVLTCPEVKEPVAVRYCFKNWQLGNVANQGGLPLIPFRTDDW